MKQPNLGLITSVSGPFPASQPALAPRRSHEGFRVTLQVWTERVFLVLALILLGNAIGRVLDLASARQSVQQSQAAQPSQAAQGDQAAGQPTESYPLNQ